MEFILSGYGEKPQTTIASYSYKVVGSDKEEAIIDLKWQDSIPNASFVCEGDGFLFTITEADDYAHVYLYQRTEVGYLRLDDRRLEGGALCHITYSTMNKALFGACYGTGTLFALSVTDGKFGELLFHEVQLGVDTTALSRVHCVLLNQNETELVVVNIALDQIYFYKVHNGILTQSQILEVPKGVGPRHVLLSKDESLLYVITEYSNEILVYRNNGEKQLLQRISTLAEDYIGTSYCSTLCFSKNGTFLYAANRGADTIALFKIQEDGILIKEKEYDCGGNQPRHMIVSQNGSYLIVCNQNSDNVAIFELDSVSGALINKVAFIIFPAPSGVHEIRDYINQGLY
jgi:6-phosphogluconolactonase